MLPQPIDATSDIPGCAMYYGMDYSILITVRLNISISVKKILILEIVLFSHYPHEPVLHLHFYLFLCLTPLSITRSSIFLELPKYSRHTVRLNLDDPSV